MQKLSKTNILTSILPLFIIKKKLLKFEKLFDSAGGETRTLTPCGTRS